MQFSISKRIKKVDTSGLLVLRLNLGVIFSKEQRAPQP
jgi:hypothetical protein